MALLLALQLQEAAEIEFCDSAVTCPGVQLLEVDFGEELLVPALLLLLQIFLAALLLPQGLIPVSKLFLLFCIF